MTTAEYRKWRRNGNFTMSQARLLQVANHIAEGEHDCYTKREAAEVASYYSLECSRLMNDASIERAEEVIELFRRFLRKAHVDGD